MELPEEEERDLLCRAWQPVSLETKVVNGDDIELLDLVAGNGELPADRLEGECLKGDLRALLDQLPRLQGRELGISRDRVPTSPVCAASAMLLRHTRWA